MLWRAYTHRESDEAIARYIAATKAPLKHPLREATNVERRSIEVGKRGDGASIEIDLTFPKPAGGKPHDDVVDAEFTEVDGDKR